MGQQSRQLPSARLRNMQMDLGSVALTVMAMALVGIWSWCQRKIDGLEMVTKQLQETVKQNEANVAAVEKQTERLATSMTALSKHNDEKVAAVEKQTEQLVSALKESVSSGAITVESITEMKQGFEQKVQNAMMTSAQNYKLSQLERKLVEQELEVLKEQVGSVTALTRAVSQLVMGSAGVESKVSDSDDDDAADEDTSR